MLRPQRREVSLEGRLPKTEKDWSTSTNLKLPYAHSKVLAEQKAWQLVDEHNAAHPERAVKLVTILPSLVIGPPVGSRVDGVSVSTVVNVLNESQLETGVNPYSIPTVDVRDVAAAHVAAIELDTAEGPLRRQLPRADDAAGLRALPGSSACPMSNIPLSSAGR